MINITTAFLTQVRSLPYLSNPYLGSLAIVIVFALLARILVFLFEWYLHTVAKHTKSELDDLVVKYLKNPVVILSVVFGVKLALLNINAHLVLMEISNSILMVTILYVVMRVVDINIEGWGKKFASRTETKLDDLLLPLFHKIAKVLFVLVAIVLVLHIWEIDVTPYLAGLGISGIVLGLALQDSLKNIFGGVSLIMDGTYEIGDKIKLESGEIGKIMDIGLRSTKLMTYDNEVLYVPNGFLANSRVLNFTRPDTKVRSKVEFGVAYGSDVEKVKKVVGRVLSKMEHVCKEPAPKVLFYEMGDFALKFRVFFWVDHWDKEADKKVESNEKIYEALQHAKINIPFPTQTVYVEKK